MIHHKVPRYLLFWTISLHSKHPFHSWKMERCTSQTKSFWSVREFCWSMVSSDLVRLRLQFANCLTRCDVEVLCVHIIVWQRTLFLYGYFARCTFTFFPLWGFSQPGIYTLEDGWSSDVSNYFDLSHNHRRRSMYTVEPGELLLLNAAW